MEVSANIQIHLECCFCPPKKYKPSTLEACLLPASVGSLVEFTGFLHPSPAVV